MCDMTWSAPQFQRDGCVLKTKSIFRGVQLHCKNGGVKTAKMTLWGVLSALMTLKRLLAGYLPILMVLKSKVITSIGLAVIFAEMYLCFLYMTRLLGCLFWVQ